MLTQGPPHLLDDLHVVERRLERFGGRVDSRHGCLHSLPHRQPGRPRRRPAIFGGFPQILTLLTHAFDGRTMLLASSRVLLAHRLNRSESSRLSSGVLAVILPLIAPDLRLLTALSDELSVDMIHRTDIHERGRNIDGPIS